ncbi:hypothetical protein DXT89_10115 [Agrobacterium vitis]|uniref:Uncharacterized protein n=1 Tax=Agrobacterium vitis TaxID=373 RepID=A0A368NVH9_AGRVI|nr:hypothetical protein DXM22_13700 [Agrobacterium vitis]KAA3528366.1 hypothetical protein DXT89_10115 [Agrobacterium vitis]RCU54552.1 hypothetical protein ASB66_005730 [Agrobacterium vitis]
MIALLLFHHFKVSFTAKFLRISSFAAVFSVERTRSDFSRTYAADLNVKRRMVAQTRGILTLH